MKKHLVIFAAIFSCVLPLSSVHADEDPMAGYNADIQKPADAKVYNINSAWAENNANLIEHGRKKGIVIKGAGDYANGKVHADGVGNVVVDKDARVRGPIINKTEIKNSTVVIKTDPYNKTRY